MKKQKMNIEELKSSILLNDDDCSMVQSKFSGSYPYLMNKVSTRYFYLIEGESLFDIAGEIKQVHAGDIVMVPPNTKYKFEGNFEAVIIDTPKFDELQEIVFDDKK